MRCNDGGGAEWSGNRRDGALELKRTGTNVSPCVRQRAFVLFLCAVAAADGSLSLYDLKRSRGRPDVVLQVTSNRSPVYGVAFNPKKTSGRGFFATSRFCGPAGFRRSTFSEAIALRWQLQRQVVPPLHRRQWATQTREGHHRQSVC